MGFCGEGCDSVHFLCPCAWMYSHTWKLAQPAMLPPSCTLTVGFS